MKISLKIFLLCLLVALFLLATNFIWYQKEYDYIITYTEQHLTAIASIQKSRIEDIHAQELLKFKLVSSRTQLRKSLDLFNKTGDTVHLNKIKNILTDVLISIPDFNNINIYSPERRLLLSQRRDSSSIIQELKNIPARVDSVYLGVSRNSLGVVSQTMNGLLLLNDTVIGILQIESETEKLNSVVMDYTGLGNTGETVLAIRGEDGSSQFVTPTRFAEDAPLTTLAPADADSVAMTRVFKGERKFLHNIFDYRGNAIWAFPQIIPSTGWGIIVKIDKDEALIPLEESQMQLVVLSLVSLGIALFFSIYLIRSITRPITLLTAHAKDVTRGNYDISSSIKNRRDEIGILANAFNNMVITVDETQNNLQNSINDLSVEIAERERVEDELTFSEKRLKNLLNLTPVGLVLCTQEGKFIQINQRFSEIVGYSQTELLTMSFWELTPEEYYQYDDKELKNVSKTRTYGPYEKQYIRKDGTTVDVRLNGMMITDNKEDLIWSSVEDITALKQAEHQREELEEKLHQSHKMEAIGTLAGGIAHDFNNILSAILGYADLAMDDDFNDVEIHKEHISGIVTAGHRAKELVTQILSFSRKTKLQQKPTNLTEVTHEILKLLRATIPASVKIESHISESNAVVLGDVTELHQVILNLCTNAVQAMKNNTGSLKISLSSEKFTDEDKNALDMYCINIVDNGIGISSDHINKIFDPYFTTKDTGKGTGMGLAVVSGIVSAHNGHIQVTSEENQGTTFKLYFPKLETDIAANPEHSPTEKRGTESIMVVDDEIAIATITRKQLERRGYPVTSFTDSIEALEFFQKHPQDFNLIITDFTMPTLSGDLFVQQIKKIRSDIPIFMCTGYSENMNEKKAKEQGINEFLMKPINYGELCTKIRTTFDNT